MQDLWKKYFSTVHMMMRFYSIQCLQCVNKEMKIIAVKASAVLHMPGKASIFQLVECGMFHLETS